MARLAHRRAIVSASVTGALCVFLALPVRAGTVPDPAVDIFVGPNQDVISGDLVPPAPGDLLWQYSGSETNADYSVEATATLDPDPFVTYGFSVMSFTKTPLPVSKHYSIPVTGGPWDTVVASLSISGVGGSKGILIDTDSAVQTAFAGGQDLQVGLGGDCFSPRAGAVACYSQSTTRSFAPRSFGTLDVYVNFVLTGAGAGATVSGRVELLDLQPDIDSAPEPGYLSLAGLILLALGIRARRKTGRTPSTLDD